jgi:hypothetical protein
VQGRPHQSPKRQKPLPGAAGFANFRYDAPSQTAAGFQVRLTFSCPDYRLLGGGLQNLNIINLEYRSDVCAAVAKRLM